MTAPRLTFTVPALLPKAPPVHARLLSASCTTFGWLLVVSLASCTQENITLQNTTSAPAVKLAPVFGDGMVLQQGRKVPIWGTAAPGEKVAVSFRGRQVEATADKDGKWRADLPAMDAGGPWPLTVTGRQADLPAGKSVITLANVYVGEVWIACGQSNMVSRVREAVGGKEAGQDHVPNLRLCWVVDDTGRPGPWQEARGQAILDFSAVAYWFGKDLAERLKTPVGIIHCGVSGSVVEQWMPLADLERLKVPHPPAFIPARTNGNWHLYQEMVAPLEPYAIRGVIWYQGEGNRGRHDDYAVWFPALIEGWRRAWGQGDFPFLFVQLPRFGQPDDVAGPKLGRDSVPMREAQAKALAVKNTAMVVYYECTDGEGHTRFKRPCGQRLALAARAVAYGEKIEYSGPVFRSARWEGARLVLSFDHADGLMTRVVPASPATPATSAPAASAAVTDLFVTDKDGAVLRVATAKVENGAVVIDMGDKASAAARLYYAWRTYPQGNLFNAAGLPAAPFRAELPAAGK